MMPKFLIILLCSCVLPALANVPKYDRSAFGGWVDSDKDCLNTRHELLLDQAIVTVPYGNCKAVYGVWKGEYTGQYYFKASSLQIDHIVPVSWAWKAGAYKWTDEQRRAFYNDTLNLIAVSSKANRSKSDKLFPTQWQPDNTDFNCELANRVQLVLDKYELSVKADLKVSIEQILLKC